MNFNELNQCHKTSLRELAQKYNRSIRTISRYAKEFEASKSREQYEANALERRKIAYELRQTGLKWREVAEKLGISTANAQMLARRYKENLPLQKE